MGQRLDGWHAPKNDSPAFAWRQGSGMVRKHSKPRAGELMSDKAQLCEHGAGVLTCPRCAQNAEAAYVPLADD